MSGTLAVGHEHSVTGQRVWRQKILPTLQPLRRRYFGRCLLGDDAGQLVAGRVPAGKFPREAVGEQLLHAALRVDCFEAERGRVGENQTEPRTVGRPVQIPHVARRLENLLNFSLWDASPEKRAQSGVFDRLLVADERK